jgi:hypothetical protein
MLFCGRVNLSCRSDTSFAGRAVGSRLLASYNRCLAAIHRRPSAGPAMPVQMQLSRIIISEINPQQVIYLKEVEGDRTFPILIGLFEAESINTGVKRVQSPRPRTHELLVQAIESLGGELDSVVISELRDHIYFAKLRVKIYL